MLPQDAGYPDPPSNLPPARRDGPVQPVAGRIEGPASPLTAELAPPPPALSAAPDLPALLRALGRRWLAAVTLGGTLAALAAAAVWFLMAPKSTAFALLKVASHPPHIWNSPEYAQQRSDFLTYMRTQAQQIKSRQVIAAALKREEVKRLNLEVQGIDPVLYIEEELKVDFQEMSEFLTVLLSSSDPAVATTLVKAITNSFMEEIVYAEEQGRRTKVADLEKILADQVASRNQKKTSLKNLADKLGTESSQVLTQQQLETLNYLRDARQQLARLKGELSKARGDLEAHDAQAKALQTFAVKDSDVETALNADPGARPTLDQIEKYRKLMETYEARSAEPEREATYVVARREFRKLKGRLDERREELRGEIKKRLADQATGNMELVRIPLVNTVNRLQEEYEKAVPEVEKLAKDAAKIGVSNIEMASLQEDIARDDKLIDDIGQNVNKLRVELRSPSRVSIFQEAELQKKDIKKQLVATAATPLMVLFAVCTGLAWGEHRKRRIRSAKEVADGLGIRVVGAVPDLPHLERHLVGPGGQPVLEGHPVLESIDAIRTLLLYDAREEDTRVVLVTSAVEGEGKTTLASHLASSLARAGRKTLLIDGDLRRPAIHQLFELPLQPGFSEVLLAEVEVADAVQATALDGLFVLPAGQWDREVMHALARNGLEAVFEKLREEFDFILIDSHPVLAATDALLIGQQTDAVILSVLREVSQTPRVYAACQRLTALGIHLLGAVVNGTDPDEVISAPVPALAAR